MENLKPKIAIIGCGNVGIRYAYALIISGIIRQLVMIDVNRKQLEGDVMDLSHGAPYISPVEIIAGDYPDIKDSDLVVITAGRKQKSGQTRIELAKDNVDLYRKIIPQVMKYAPLAKILVVSNPVDILAYAAYKISGKPSNEVIGSGTVLDSARFRFLLSRFCEVDAHNIHAYILGEHGDTEFPVWSRAMVAGMSFKEYCLHFHRHEGCNREGELEKIFREVKNSAYEIIEKKGETSYGIGLAMVRITRAIIRDENAALSVSSLVNGFLGVEDVFLSLPAVINKSGISVVFPMIFNEIEQKAFRDSADALKKILKQTGL